MNNETKILKDWIYEETEIYFYMVGKTDTVINEIKKHSKKSILNLSKKEIKGIVSVVSDIIKQSMNILINKIKIKIKEDKKRGIEKKIDVAYIKLLGMDLKAIEYNKLALCYFNLLVKRYNCLKEF
jgi:hypothetical protein